VVLKVLMIDVQSWRKRPFWEASVYDQVLLAQLFGSHRSRIGKFLSHTIDPTSQYDFQRAPAQIAVLLLGDGVTVCFLFSLELDDALAAVVDMTQEEIDCERMKPPLQETLVDSSDFDVISTHRKDGPLAGMPD
jgi:hypothetical protein